MSKLTGRSRLILSCITQGEWSFSHEIDCDGRHHVFVSSDCGGVLDCLTGSKPKKADMQFICISPKLIQALVEEVELMESALMEISIAICGQGSDQCSSGTSLKANTIALDTLRQIGSAC